MIVTIACPMGLEHPEVAADSPVWVDATGNEYRVASGVVEGIDPTEWTEAAPDRVTIIVGMEGLAALAAMGLSKAEAME